MSDAIPRIRISGLRKDFPLKAKPLTLFQMIKLAIHRPRSNGRTFQALAGVDLEVHEGEILGLIGHNGAGKSTLLKMIARLHAPTAGRVEVNGRTVLLAGLGIGMVSDLSVRANIFLYGAICGLSRARLTELFDEIVDWAELAPFVDSPLRALSTGMKSRLAFSIARHVDSEILLMDEAFSAGDARFRHKCDDFFRSRAGSSQTIVVATHSMAFVREFCSRGVLLKSGQCVACGDPADVLAQYEKLAS